MSSISGITPRVVTAADVSPVAGKIRIHGLRFVSSGTAIGSCTVQDDAGNAVWVASGVGTISTVGVDQSFFNRLVTLNGHKVSAIANGTLYIYQE